MAAGLTNCQEKFLDGLMHGKSQRQAYIAAYPKAAGWKPEAVDAKASNLLKKDKVWIRYTELQAEARRSSAITRDDLVREVKSVAFVGVDPGKIKEADLMRYKIEALKLLAKILGFDEMKAEPEEKAVDPSAAILERIYEVMKDDKTGGSAIS